MTERIADFFSELPDELITTCLAAMPVTELRGSIPCAIVNFPLETIAGSVGTAVGSTAGAGGAVASGTGTQLARNIAPVAPAADLRKALRVITVSRRSFLSRFALKLLIRLFLLLI